MPSYRAKSIFSKSAFFWNGGSIKYKRSKVEANNYVTHFNLQFDSDSTLLNDDNI